MTELSFTIVEYTISNAAKSILIKRENSPREVYVPIFSKTQCTKDRAIIDMKDYLPREFPECDEFEIFIFESDGNIGLCSLPEQVREELVFEEII